MDEPVETVVNRFSARWGLVVMSALTLVLLVRGIALLVPFQFDDLHQIVDNPPLRDPTTFPRFFTDPWVGSSLGNVWFYRPILFTTFLVDGVIGGGSAIPYRVTSLLLLAAFTVIAAWFTQAVLPRLAPDCSQSHARVVGILGGAILAVHPLLNESVLLATGRSSLLMAVFGLAAITVMIESRTAAGTAWVAALTILALLTKETAVVLAPLALLVSWVVFTNEPGPRRFRPALPIIVLVATYVVWYYLARRVGPLSGPPPMPRSASLSRDPAFMQRLAEGAVALAGLGRLYVVPVGLSLVHEVRSLASSLRWVAPAIWLGVLLGPVVLMRWRGTPRVIGFGLLWYVLALAPIVTAGLNTPMGEHRVVLAAVGLSVAVAWLVGSIPDRHVRVSVLSAMVLLLAIGSVSHAWQWRTPVGLWSHEVAQHPESARAWGFLASSYVAEGDLDQAREAARQAVELTPHSVLALGQAAQIEMQAGNLEAARPYTIEGLLREPDHLGLLLLEAERAARVGDFDGALAAAERAAVVAPNVSAVWNALGNVQLMMEDATAVASYRRAVELDPDNYEATYNLEKALARWPG